MDPARIPIFDNGDNIWDYTGELPEIQNAMPVNHEEVVDVRITGNRIMEDRS